MRCTLSWTSLLGIMVIALTGIGCSAKKNAATDHFGVKPNFPRFESVKQFSDHYRKVTEITQKRTLDGQPLDLSWMTPIFRERLCLVVTINDHCAGG
jgi:hypothetical protein